MFWVHQGGVEEKVVVCTRRLYSFDGLAVQESYSFFLYWTVSGQSDKQIEATRYNHGQVVTALQIKDLRYNLWCLCGFRNRG